jgi:hypothetical protein
MAYANERSHAAEFNLYGGARISSPALFGFPVMLCTAIRISAAVDIEKFASPNRDWAADRRLARIQTGCFLLQARSPSTGTDSAQPKRVGADE